MKADLPVTRTIDGNEAAAHVAYRVNEVCAIYPITPSSPMAELADEWASKGLKNIWGNIPEVVEMQSEGGAAGAVHGSLQGGSLTTTFTASQGLMLMLPNMYKIAGELTPAVIHVAARSLAAQALSIFGDHQDVMAARSTGFGLVASSSVQEAHDLALIAQAVSLRSRIPFVHFFDGFRTSHEVAKIRILADEQIRKMIRDEWLFGSRGRALNPNSPFIRGTAQNPDVYFQGRETVNPYYDSVAGIFREECERFREIAGREYEAVEYRGAPDAEKVVILMGSGAETACETVEHLAGLGEKVGAVRLRLYRPFPVEDLVSAIPESVRRIAVLDRTKEPGAVGEPLYQDVVAAYAEAKNGDGAPRPVITGGRYGLSSKEFTPAMVKSVFDSLGEDRVRKHFTVGIRDDVGGTSLEFDSEFRLDETGWTQAMFFGLGSDGTVGANKNSIKIIGEETDLHAQGYFVYDSKKSGAKTVSHLRFGPEPIRAPYLIGSADLVACHQFGFLKREEMLSFLKPGGIFLLNAPYGRDEVWERIPGYVQQEIIDKKVRLYAVDAAGIAMSAGLGGRINTVMQTCFFALSKVIPTEEAVGHIKDAIRKSYSTKGRVVIEKNFEAVDNSVKGLSEIDTSAGVTNSDVRPDAVPAGAPEFVRNVTSLMIDGKGDSLPVSALPSDGTFPSGTAKFEKRDVSPRAAVWEPDLCVQCGNCAFVCPHSVIRAKYFHRDGLDGAPEGFPSAPINARGYPETRYALNVYAEDCTGCNLCYDVCPVTDRDETTRRAINVVAKPPSMQETRERIGFFEALPGIRKTDVDYSTVHGVQFLEPYFEFSGACAGCGETPYIKVLTQLFGDRLVVANATGCSSIYGGNLPTTPWTNDADGKGPAWSNSLFEDNAEFGLGMRLASDKQRAVAEELLAGLREEVGSDLAAEIASATQRLESEVLEQRRRVAVLKEKLAELDSVDARRLLSVADHLVNRSVWLVGGDGWAYDIGSAGLDHVLASGRNVNVLVLDTEVYSNTGGQMSKATPTAASAKFAAAGKRVGKKDLALQAITYGNVYVAQVAMGANPQQTLLAMREAEAYPGPSLVLAYSHCIAHGINMEHGLRQQKLAVDSGYWPLIRYNPVLRMKGGNPFVLDSTRASIPLKTYAYNELRYRVLTQTNPSEAESLMEMAQEIVDLRWKTYEEMAGFGAKDFPPVPLKEANDA